MEYEKIILKVKDYLKEVTNQVVVFDADLMTRKEQLEEVSKGVHLLVRDGHMTEKIRQKQPMTMEVIKALEVEIGSCRQKTRHELVINGKVYRIVRIVVFCCCHVSMLSERKAIPCSGRQLNSGSQWQHHLTQ